MARFSSDELSEMEQRYTQVDRSVTPRPASPKRSFSEKDLETIRQQLLQFATKR